MTDLTEYAQRSARREFPHRSPMIDAGYMAEERSRQALRKPYAAGILHLAERLQEPDVIEAGARAAVNIFEGGGAFEVLEEIQRRDALTQVGAALAAMLQHIAGGEK